MMKKSLRALSVAVSGGFLLGMLCSPAYATINLVDASSIQGENVLFNNGPSTGTTVFGATNQTDTSVKFTSTVTLRASGGQADITGALNLATPNPNDTINYTNLAISLNSGGTFNNLELNLIGGNATSVTFTLIDNAGVAFSFANLALSNGSNFFGFHGIDGESIRSASYWANGTGIQSTQQVRLDALPLVSAAPEPATWSMMIIGFGLAGGAMRRRRTARVLTHA